MRRFFSGQRHYRAAAPNPPPVDPTDNLSTWSNTAQLVTAVLPGTSVDKYHIVVDVSNAITSAAKLGTSAASLRFVHENGTRMSHKRTPGGRVLLIGDFFGGKNVINYYWGKAGATQPGLGFQTSDAALADYRLALIFESSAPLDVSPNPITFSTVGTPTYEPSPLGQALRCADGSYIETTAAKLRGSARSQRSIFTVITLPTATIGGRVICWANWLNSNRAFQLWMRPDGLELYISDNGTDYKRWDKVGYQVAGRNSIGASWKANTSEAILLLNQISEVTLPDFNVTPPGQLFDSSDPYIIGGTKVSGNFFTGTVECVFEYAKEFASPNHLLVWRFAWSDNDLFWNKSDREPDNFDVPDLANVALSTEVPFAKKQITGISNATHISVTGDGSPSYAIGSSFNSSSDIRAKGSTNGTINPGQWLSTYHTSSATNSTLQESSVLIGTVTSPRRSTTVAAVVGGGTSIPTGTADIIVSNVANLKSNFASIQGGKILGITPGDYKDQGTVELQNRDFRGGQPIVIRGETIPYRGYLTAQGGLLVSGETFHQSGSGGAEFSRIILRNVHNVVIQNIRTYQGNVGTAGEKWYTLECVNCSNITFENSKFCGYRPDYDPYQSEDSWTTLYKADNPWLKQGRGVQLGVGGQCSHITFKKCMFHYFNLQLYNGNSLNTLIEDCLFTDAKSDHVRSDGGQDNFTCRRVIFGRTWGTRNTSSSGIDHCDSIQNTTKTQSGWRNHSFIDCIIGPLDALYPHIQGVFYECDLPDQYPIGNGLNVTNCLLEGRAPNMIYARPGNKTIVTLCTVLQCQFGGRSGSRDLTFNAPSIFVNAHNRSFGNNKIDRCVYYNHDFTIPGDTVVGSTQLLPADYPVQLNDYPIYSASIWRPVMFYNPYTGVIDVNEIRRWSPKTNAAIHPNQKGAHHGASQLLQSLGALL